MHLITCMIIVLNGSYKALILETKIMIFNKRGHSITKYNFTYGNVPLQIYNDSYLGIIFTPSGSFQTAIDNLKDKASEAFFKIRENHYGSSVKCGFKLFTTLIRPLDLKLWLWNLGSLLA